MNALVLDGSRDGKESRILAVLREVLANAGYAVDVVALRDKTIAPCLGCFGCWVKTPGECVIDDDGRLVARSLARGDLIVYFTPVTFGGVSSELKKALDRMIPNILPFFASYHGETHHVKRYRRSPSLAALGILPSADAEAEAVFRTLIEHNATNLQSPRSATAILALDSKSDAKAITRALVETVTR